MGIEFTAGKWTKSYKQPGKSPNLVKDWYRLPVGNPTLTTTSYFNLALENVAETGRKGIRVTNRGNLPGETDTAWTLYYAGYQGAMPSNLVWEQVPLQVTGGQFSYLLANPMSAATYIFFLSATHGQQTTSYSQNQISTPSDSVYLDITAVMTSDILSKAQKPQVKLNYDTILAIQPALNSAALAWGTVLNVQRAAYNTAITNLTTYITALSPALTDYTQNTDLGSGGGATLNGLFSQVDQTKQALQNAINNIIRNYGTTTDPTQINGGVVADGTLEVTALAAGQIKTTNYTEEDGTHGTGYANGTPIAGVKLDHTGTSLKVAANNVQIGPYTLTDSFFRALNALDGANSTGKTFYRGCIDISARGGAPDITKFAIQSAWQDPTNKRFCLNLFLRPNSVSDNLDAMRYARIDFYRGTSSSASLIMTNYVNLPDRLYVANDPSSNNNAAVSWFFENDTTSYIVNSSTPMWYLLVTIFNAYGPSDSRWFIPPSSLNSDWTQQTSAPFTGGSSGSSGGGSGGSSGGSGGSCPTPEVLIDLADGSQIQAGQVSVGMKVSTVHEASEDGSYGEYEVESVEPSTNEVWKLELEDGRSFTFAANHRFLTSFAWLELQAMTAGINLMGKQPGVVKSVEKVADQAEVVKITIKDAHTYQTSGILSHNIKVLNQYS